MDTILLFPRDQGTDMSTMSGKAELYAKFGFNLQVGSIGATLKEINSFIEFWKPVACVVNDDKLPIAPFRGIPTVFCHRDPKTLPSHSILFGYDESAIAQMAARELLCHNLASYCFVPHPSGDYWSQGREQGFLRAMTANFRRKNTSVCPVHGKSLPQIHSCIANHLLTLPKPIGVFAANDETARTVVDACIHAHLNIPNDVVLLGVDNNIAFCERPDVSISSIKVGASGDPNLMLAVRKLISGHLRGITIIRRAPTGVVRRASTMRFARTDREVQAAVELIRRQACGGLTANEVIGTFNCSRRMAETRFRATTGHSILDEIQEIRIKKAKELLADGKLKADEIAARCGYRSRSSVFRLLAKNS